MKLITVLLNEASNSKTSKTKQLKFEAQKEGEFFSKIKNIHNNFNAHNQGANIFNNDCSTWRYSVEALTNNEEKGKWPCTFLCTSYNFKLNIIERTLCDAKFFSSFELLVHALAKHFDIINQTVKSKTKKLNVLLKNNLSFFSIIL